jgi:hypothetical protein
LSVFSALTTYVQREGLVGGACSLLRTRLRANSLLTGKITGNTVVFDPYTKLSKAITR